MTDITEIKRGLESSILTVCEYLLPGGRKEGHEFRAGDIGGGAGKSLGVHLSGNKVGIWSDFASGESGDIISLWCAAKQMKVSDGLNDMRDWLGYEKPDFTNIAPKRQYTKPPKPNCSKPKSAVLKYMTEERFISTETLCAFKIGENGSNIIFPFIDPDGEAVLFKSRKAENGGKPKPTEADCKPILFGWQSIPDDARSIFITEGEIDAMTMYQYGFPALSVPFGGGAGGKQNWIENEYDNLDRFERIYLTTDTDKEGEAAATEIADRLGRHRCFRVVLPHKDANDCLKNGVLTDQIQLAVDGATTLDPPGLVNAEFYKGEVANLFYPAENEHVGYRTAYSSIGDDLLFRPAEVTIWTGASGSGKSQMISDNIPSWITQGSNVCLASLEMAPRQSLKRLVKQAGCCDRPPMERLNEIFRFLGSGLYVYGKVGKVTIKKLLEVFDYSRKKYGCDQFVIDSLMRLGIASDDYNGQENAMFEVVNWAIENNVHVHMVAHSRKTQNGGPQETEDIKGASEIGSNAFNILAVWRNRAEIVEGESRIDAIMNVAKQRNGDFEGKVYMEFNQQTYQYRAFKDGDSDGRKYL